MREDGDVTARIPTDKHGDPIGQVLEVGDAVSRDNGRVEIEHRWEVRRPHEYLIEAPVGQFPTFETEEEAVRYLIDSRIQGTSGLSQFEREMGYTR